MVKCNTQVGGIKGSSVGVFGRLSSVGAGLGLGSSDTGDPLAARAASVRAAGFGFEIPACFARGLGLGAASGSARLWCGR